MNSVTIGSDQGGLLLASQAVAHASTGPIDCFVRTPIVGFCSACRVSTLGPPCGTVDQPVRLCDCSEIPAHNLYNDLYVRAVELDSLKHLMGVMEYEHRLIFKKYVHYLCIWY
jgi:hypothetical protein